MEKLESLKWLISDLLDLKEYYEQLDHAILFEANENIDDINTCLKDFDSTAMIQKLKDLMESTNE